MPQLLELPGLLLLEVEAQQPWQQQALQPPEQRAQVQQLWPPEQRVQRALGQPQQGLLAQVRQRIELELELEQQQIP